MSLKETIISSFTGLLIAHSSVVLAEEVGLIMDLSGNATAELGGKNQRLESMSYISHDMKVLLGPKAAITFTYYPNNKLYSLTGPSVFDFKSNALRVIKGNSPIEKSLDESKTKLARTGAGRTTLAGVIMRGPDNVNSPYDGDVVITTAPDFSWQSSSSPVTFKVTDEHGKMVFEKSVSASSITLTNATLEPENRYQWELIRESDRHTLFKATFSVLEANRAKELNRLKPKSEDEIADWVFYAIALDYEGANSEAKKVWQMLAQKRPDSRYFHGRAVADNHP